MFIEIDGLTIYYASEGEGDSVVLLHGWGGQSSSFKPVFDFLIKSYKVYMLDLPGFGRSGIPPHTWGTFNYASFVSKVFAKLGITKAHIIGHSFGGRIAIVLAANFSKLVDKLILVNSAGIRPKRTVKYYAFITIAKIGKILLSPKIWGRYGERVKNALYNLVGSEDYRNAGELRDVLVKVVNEDLRALLPRIEVPTLLVWGGKDKKTPILYAKIMEEKIKNSHLVILKDAGHFSYLDEFPQFCCIISEFLS
ncbi:MAG: alpha/beta fold hydrolase [Candidatus Poribacteria bacterium]